MATVRYMFSVKVVIWSTGKVEVWRQAAPGEYLGWFVRKK